MDKKRKAIEVGREMRKTQKDKDGGGRVIVGVRVHRRGGWRKTESGSMRRRTI